MLGRAGIGVGVYRDVDEAIARCLRLGDRFEPDPAAGAFYEERFAAFRELMGADVTRT